MKGKWCRMNWLKGYITISRLRRTIFKSVLYFPLWVNCIWSIGTMECANIYITMQKSPWNSSVTKVYNHGNTFTVKWQNMFQNTRAETCIWIKVHNWAKRAKNDSRRFATSQTDVKRCNTATLTWLKGSAKQPNSKGCDMVISTGHLGCLAAETSVVRSNNRCHVFQGIRVWVGVDSKWLTLRSRPASTG